MSTFFPFALLSLSVVGLLVSIAFTPAVNTPNRRLAWSLWTDLWMVTLAFAVGFIAGMPT